MDAEKSQGVLQKNNAQTNLLKTLVCLCIIKCYFVGSPAGLSCSTRIREIQLSSVCKTVSFSP